MQNFKTTSLNMTIHMQVEGFSIGSQLRSTEREKQTKGCVNCAPLWPTAGVSCKNIWKHVTLIITVKVTLIHLQEPLDSTLPSLNYTHLQVSAVEHISVQPPPI